MVSEFYFSREREVSDLALFVHPEHRGGMAGPALLRSFVTWAKKRGIRHLGINVSTGVMVEKTGALLERVGFKRVGGSFAMEVEAIEAVLA
jgi:GNAT superfamily N-acetyltransferase